MKYIVDVNGERITVDLDGTHAEVNGVRHDVALAAVPGKPVRLVRLGEQVHRVSARRGAGRGQWVLDVDGLRVAAEALDERLRAIRDLTAASEAASGPAPLVAPMPGLVVRIAVSVGDEVARKYLGFIGLYNPHSAARTAERAAEATAACDGDSW